MKKIFVVLGVLVSFLASAQVPKYNINYSNYDFANHLKVGKSLGIPKDTLASAPDSSIAIVNFVLYQKLGYWQPVSGTGTGSSLVDKVLDKGSVSYKGYGFHFYVQEAVYRIANLIYNSDSASITLSASDPDNPRKDVIYLATDGAVHVMQGVAAPSAAEPQLDGDQIKLTVIDIPAGSTTPALGQEVIYNENIEWTVTQSGATVDADNTSNVWIGSKSINWTNINQGDLIYLTRPLGSLNMLSWQAISISIQLKAILPITSFVRVTFFNGSLQVSNERPINLNRNSLVYQAIDVPTSDFVFSNYNIDRVRIRYTNSAGAAIHPGAYLDDIDLISGFVPTGGGGTSEFSYTLTMPSAFQTSPATVTNNGTHTVTGAGSTSQYIDGTGALRSFTAWHTQGAIDGVAKTAFGFGVSGNIFYQQYADATYPGLLSALSFRRFDSSSLRSVENGTGGDTLLVYVDPFTSKIKSLIAGTNVTFGVDGESITINASGGGGTTLYTGNSNLTSNRTLDGDNNSLSFIDLSEFTVKSPGTTTRIVADALSTSLYSAEGNAIIGVSDGRADITGDTYIGALSGFGSGNVTVNNDGKLIWSASVSTPTFQQVLDAGSTLTGSETIALGSNPLSLTGFYINSGSFNSATGGLALNTSSAPTLGLTTNYSGTSNFFARTASSEGAVASFANTSLSSTTGPGRIMNFARYSTGTPTDGIAADLGFFLETAGTGGAEGLISNRFVSKFSTVDHATRTSQVDLMGMDNAVEETFMNVQKDLIRFNNNADTAASKANVRNVLGGKQGADVASAAGAITLGGDGDVFEITGTSAITLISNLIWQQGSQVTLIFTSTATLTDGTANSGTNIGMELAGNANFSATADDVITLLLSEIGGTQRWREVSRTVN